MADFPSEWNNGVYFRVRKIPQAIKDSARARQTGATFRLAARCQVLAALAHERHEVVLIATGYDGTYATGSLAQSFQWTKAVLVQTLDLEIEVRVILGYGFGDEQLRIEGR